MNRIVWPAVGFVVLVIGGLVLLTDFELALVKWVNCGPLSTPSEDRSHICQ